MNRFKPSQLMVGALAVTCVVVGFGNELRANYVSMGAALALAGFGVVVVSGWARQVNLAQYGFLFVGAYAASACEGLPFGLRLLIGGLAAAIVAIPVGLAASRLAGLALGALTLVVGLTVWSLSRAPEVMKHIGGDTFIGATVTRPAFVHSDRGYAVLALVIGVAGLVAVLLLRRTRTGMALCALDAGERVMGAIGLDSRRLVMIGFVISAALAGVGGVVLAGGFGGVNANDVVPFNSIVLYAFLFNAGIRRPAAAVFSAALVPLMTALALPGWILPLVGGAGLIWAGSTMPSGVLGLLDFRVLASPRRQGLPLATQETAGEVGAA